jgi:uncharacterized protein YbbK (DUF523 family)
LKDHEATHTGIKQYVCKECGKGFTQKRNLNKHIVTVHKEGKSEKEDEDEGNDAENEVSEQEEEMLDIVEEKSLEDLETHTMTEKKPI